MVYNMLVIMLLFFVFVLFRFVLVYFTCKNRVFSFSNRIELVRNPYKLYQPTA